MQKEKIRQAVAILKEKDIDLWMTVVRETMMGSDPVLPFLASIDFSGTTALCITSAGRVAALVSSADAEGVRQTGLYDEVIPSKTTFDQACWICCKKSIPAESPSITLPVIMPPMVFRMACICG